MLRRKGSMNYKYNFLINIVLVILPNGELGWQAVAHAHHEQSKKEIVGDSSDLKKHWFKTLCNGMKRPMGWTGDDGNWIH